VSLCEFVYRRTMTSALNREASMTKLVAIVVEAALLLPVPEFPESVDPDVEGAPDPPARLESWAKPTEGGDARNTEYTFFRKVSPMTQVGLPDPLWMLVPILRSKIEPRHFELPRSSWPLFMSCVLIGHVLPPNENDTETEAVHGKLKTLA